LFLGPARQLHALVDGVFVMAAVRVASVHIRGARAFNIFLFFGIFLLIF
jgi:hypothetical protein